MRKPYTLSPPSPTLPPSPPLVAGNLSSSICVVVSSGSLGFVMARTESNSDEAVPLEGDAKGPAIEQDGGDRSSFRLFISHILYSLYALILFLGSFFLKSFNHPPRCPFSFLGLDDNLGFAMERKGSESYDMVTPGWSTALDGDAKGPVVEPEGDDGMRDELPPIREPKEVPEEEEDDDRLLTEEERNAYFTDCDVMMANLAEARANIRKYVDVLDREEKREKEMLEKENLEKERRARERMEMDMKMEMEMVMCRVGEEDDIKMGMEREREIERELKFKVEMEWEMLWKMDQWMEMETKMEKWMKRWRESQSIKWVGFGDATEEGVGEEGRRRRGGFGAWGRARSAQER